MLKEFEENCRWAYQVILNFFIFIFQGFLKFMLFFYNRMHHSFNESLSKEFEFEPPIDRRAECNYVGLKNAGATCYMNSVLQQLYNVPNVREQVHT